MCSILNVLAEKEGGRKKERKGGGMEREQRERER
jgi:hypothetical protein